jgi:hypothetical protein
VTIALFIFALLFLLCCLGVGACVILDNEECLAWSLLLGPIFAFILSILSIVHFAQGVG